MGIFSNIVSTIKRNTLDRTDLDERIGGAINRVINPPLISPQPTPTPTPRPSFKTEPANKLANRLEEIKQFGKSALQSIYDDEGYVRRGRVTPFAPLDDKIKASGPGRMVQRFVENTRKGVEDLGTGFGGGVAAQLDANRMNKEVETSRAITEANLQRIKQLREAGKLDEARKLAEINLKQATRTRESIASQDDRLEKDSEVGKKKTITGAIKTAETISALAPVGAAKAATGKLIGVGAKQLITPAVNTAVGMGLGGLISKATGEGDPWEQAGDAGADALRFSGVTRYTSPMIEKIVGRLPAAKNIILNQLLQRGTSAAGNVGEGIALDRLNDMETTPTSLAIDAATGFALNSAANKQVKNFFKPETKAPKVKAEPKVDANGRIHDIKGLFAKKYNNAIDFITANGETAKHGMINRSMEIDPQTGLRKTTFVVSGHEFDAPHTDGKVNQEALLLARKEGRRAVWVDEAGELRGTPPNEVKYKPMTQMTSSAMGAIAGMEMEQDENGNYRVNFDPQKAAVGMAVTAGVQNKQVKNALKATKFPSLEDAWKSAEADAKLVIKNGDISPEEASQLIPKTAINNHIEAITKAIEEKIGRALNPQEAAKIVRDYGEFRTTGNAEVMLDDSYLKNSFGYDKRSIKNILQNRTTRPGSTLANADATRMVDSEPAWTPRKTYTNNAPPDKGLLEGFDANGNPLTGNKKTVNPSKRPVADILTPEGQLQMKAEAIATEFNIPDKVEAIKAQLEKGLTPAQVRKAIDEHLTKTIGDNYPEVTGAHSTPSVDDPVIKPHKPQSTVGGVDPLIQEARKYKSAEEFVNHETTKKFGSQYVDNNDSLFYRATKTDGKRRNGFYSSDPMMAESFLPWSGDGYLTVSKVDIKKPYYMDADELEYFNQNAQRMIKDLKNQGYDGIIEKNTLKTEVGQPGEEWQRIAFDDNQVKEIARIKTDRLGVREKIKSQLTEIWNKANAAQLPKPQSTVGDIPEKLYRGVKKGYPNTGGQAGSWVTSDYATAQKYAGEGGKVIEVPVSEELLSKLITPGYRTENGVKQFQGRLGYNDAKLLGMDNFNVAQAPKPQSTVGGKFEYDQDYDNAVTKQTIDQILTSKTPTPEPKVKVEEKVIDSKTGLEKALEEVNAQALKRNARLDAQAKRLTKKYGISENELIRLRENKNGEFNISAKDQAVLDSISNYLADANGIPQEGRLPNHFPHLDVTRPERMTPSSSYAGRIAGTYDPAMTRRNLIPEENLVGSVEAWKQSGYSADQKRYGDVFQAKTIMEENNLPREKGDEVLEAVKKQGEKVKSLEEGHLKNTTFNQVGDVDYLKDTRAFDDEIARIAGKPIDRPVIKARMKTLLSKAVDASVNVVRGDNNVIQQRTNPEVFNAYKIMRDSNLPNSRTNHGKALENFVKVASNYEYEDKQVEGIINLIIDNEIKTGKVKKSLYTQTFRLITGIFSGAHIGGNVKTIITQPTELYRVAAEEGAGNLAKGFQTVFKEAPRLRKDYGLDEMTAQALEANPEYKKVKAESLMDKASDLNERILNVTMAGMKWSEEWKNIILVAAAEQKGLQKGLEVGSEAMTHFVRDELFRVGHIGSKYSTPQIIKGKGGKAALLQYSQYALKNFVLKYDTILDAEKPALTRAANVFKQVLADTAATLTVAGITGIPIKTALELFSNSQLPTGLGPIYSVPKEMWDEFKQYNTDQANAKPGEEVESLSSRWGNTIQRNFQPFGNQYLKSKGGYEALNKGYGESKKGNVKYATGDLNPIQKAQVLLFGANAIPNKQKSDKAYADLDAGKSTVYPTLGKTESAILKGLPKDQQEAYYNKQQSLQTPISTLLKGETAKKPNLIESILGGKKVEAKSLTAIPDETTTPEELTKFNSYVKAKLDSGIAPTDEELKAYFFAKIDKMPTSTGSETQNKQVELFKKIDSIYESQTLDDATKDKLIGMSGLSKEDVEYYNLAKDDATVKAMREEEKSGTMSREDWLQSLVDRRRMVGNKQIMDNATINMLYERGVLSDKERDYLNAIKYDPATKKFYLDRDYKGGGGGGMSKSDINKILNTQQDIFDAAEKLRKTNTKEPEKRQSLTSFVASGKKAQKQTIAQILGKSGKNVLSDITQVSQPSSKIRVKRKYY